MIRKLISSWKFVRAGDYMDSGDYASAFRAMERVKELAGSDYQKTSLFELNMRMALAAKMCGQPDVSIEEIRQAKNKISKSKSINESERKYLTIFCDILEEECRAGGSAIVSDLYALHKLLQSESVRKRFKNSYPIEV